MATTYKVLGQSAPAGATATTLYTVPSATTAVVTNIVVTNTGASGYTFDLALNGTKLAAGVSIAANSIATFDIKQVLAATNTIQGGASNTAVNFHISGVEVS